MKSDPLTARVVLSSAIDRLKEVREIVTFDPDSFDIRCAFCVTGMSGRSSCELHNELNRRIVLKHPELSLSQVYSMYTYEEMLAWEL